MDLHHLKHSELTTHVTPTKEELCFEETKSKTNQDAKQQSPNKAHQLREGEQQESRTPYLDHLECLAKQTMQFLRARRSRHKAARPSEVPESAMCMQNAKIVRVDGPRPCTEAGTPSRYDRYIEHRDVRCSTVVSDTALESAETHLLRRFLSFRETPCVAVMSASFSAIHFTYSAWQVVTAGWLFPKTS